MEYLIKENPKQPNEEMAPWPTPKEKAEKEKEQTDDLERTSRTRRSTRTEQIPQDR